MYYEWIMKKTNTSKPLQMLNRVYTYLENCFGHMVSLLCQCLYGAEVRSRMWWSKSIVKMDLTQMGMSCLYPFFPSHIDSLSLSPHPFFLLHSVHGLRSYPLSLLLLYGCDLCHIRWLTSSKFKFLDSWLQHISKVWFYCFDFK